MPFPLAVAPAAIKAAEPLASYFGHRLEGDERQRVEAGFVEAMRLQRLDEETPSLSDERGLKARYNKGKRKLARVRSAFPLSTQDQGVAKSGKERHDLKVSYKGNAILISQQLTEAWRAAPIAVAADGVTQEVTGKSQSREHWTRKLVQLLTDSATDGASGRLERSELAGEDKEKLIRAWRYVINGDPTSEPSSDEVDKWAEAIASSVVPIWRKAGLGSMLKQLNFESHYGLMTVLAASGQDIAVSLKRLAYWAIPTLLVGGGGIALLVLYVDKG